MTMLKGHIKLATFTGLKKDVDYTIKVRTVVNGKTICHVREEIKTDAENLPTETQEAPVQILSYILYQYFIKEIYIIYILSKCSVHKN